MNRPNSVFYAYLLRLPGFLGVHLLSLIAYRVIRPQEFIGMFLLYSLVFLIDQHAKRRGIYIAAVLALGVLCFFLGFYGGTAAVLFAMIYRTEGYSDVFIALWFVFYLLAGALLGVAYPEGVTLCCVYMFVMAIILLVCRQGERLWVFSYSFYCRESPRQTVREIYKRSERFVIPLLIIVALSGTAAILWDYGELQEGFAQDWDKAVDVISINLDRAEELVSQTRPDFERYEGNYEEPPDYGWLVAIIRIIGMVGSAAAAAAIIFFLTSRHKKKELSAFDDFEDSIEEFEAAGLSRRVKRPERSFERGLNARVRRIFKSKVRKYGRRNLIVPLRGDTPQMLADKMMNTDRLRTKDEARMTEGLEPLTRLYHKARYSGAEVTKEDMAELP